MNDYQGTQPSRCECHDCTQARWLMDIRSQWMKIPPRYPQDVTSPTPTQQQGPVNNKLDGV